MVNSQNDVYQLKIKNVVLCLQINVNICYQHKILQEKKNVYLQCWVFQKGKTRQNGKLNKGHAQEIGRFQITFYFIKLCGVELRSPAKDQMNKMRQKLLMNKYAILGKSFHLFSSRIFYLEYLHIGKKTKKLKNSQRDYVIF